jgi:hypothetical protein
MQNKTKIIMMSSQNKRSKSEEIKRIKDLDQISNINLKKNE